MKLASFDAGGRRSHGIVDGDQVVDTGSATGIASLRHALEAKVDFAAERKSAPVVALSDVVLAPLIWDTDRIICVGLNYKSHLEELGFPPPEIPMLFVRFADSLVGPGQPLVRPRASIELDFEGELAVVIGRGGRHISRDDALDHVAGYSCLNDGPCATTSRRPSSSSRARTSSVLAPSGPGSSPPTSSSRRVAPR